jgi:hypothetical protein
MFRVSLDKTQVYVGISVSDLDFQAEETVSQTVRFMLRNDGCSDRMWDENHTQITYERMRELE